MNDNTPNLIAPPVIGEPVKVFLRGESPWAECVTVHDDGTWTGRIANDLRATELHGYKLDDREVFAQTTNEAGRIIWAPKADVVEGEPFVADVAPPAPTEEGIGKRKPVVHIRIDIGVPNLDGETLTLIESVSFQPLHKHTTTNELLQKIRPQLSELITRARNTKPRTAEELRTERTMAELTKKPKIILPE